jgi:hypothetical protein
MKPILIGPGPAAVAGVQGAKRARTKNIIAAVSIDLHPLPISSSFRNTPIAGTGLFRNFFRGVLLVPRIPFFKKESLRSLDDFYRDHPYLISVELLAKLLKNKEVVIPGKRSATRNPGFSNSSGFRLSPEWQRKGLLQQAQLTIYNIKKILCQFFRAGHRLVASQGQVGRRGGR